MTRRTKWAIIVLTAAALATGRASAHHSYAMFDINKQVTLEGVVRDFQWTNPHVWMQIVVEEGGKPVEYSIEASSPMSLTRRGWTRHAVKAGDRIKMTIHPTKDESKTGSFVSMVLPDGKVLGES